jgi:hypothetical protein
VTDRRALVVGSWLAKGRDRPTPQRVNGITGRWKELFKEDRLGLRSLTNKRKHPPVFHNPTATELMSQLESASKIEDDTELLFYFVGHSVSSAENDIKLILGLTPEGEDRSCSLSWLLQAVREQAQIRNLVLILDTCHAGRTQGTLQAWGDNYFAMFAAGDAYAFDANFSDGLLRALEQPIRKNDQRVDRRAGGITYRKVFEEARRRVLAGHTDSASPQDPICAGEYGSRVLLDVATEVPDEYNEFVSSRTVYGRIFYLLEFIRDHTPTMNSLQSGIRENDSFLLERMEGRTDRYVSFERIQEYVYFLRKAEWIIQPKGRLELTEDGLAACDRRQFNKLLQKAIQEYILSDGITFEDIDEIVRSLLTDMIPPTPVRLKDRGGMMGKVLVLDAATRVAIQLLPSTGRFMKGAADAIYPAA